MMKVDLHIGDIQLSFVSGGTLRVDGGTMFGVIPRVMWERVSSPDELNRILLETNCVIVRTADSLGIIDTGYGGKTTPKQRRHLGLEEGETLVRSLAAADLSPGQIDWVVLTHLHFDHAGGATRRDSSGRLQPTFPRARHYVQRVEWEDAVAQLPELAGAYSEADFAPLEAAGQLELVDGNAEVVPGVSLMLTGGHTRGHQIVGIESGGQSAVVLADICPTPGHLPSFWTMAYDQFPLDVRRVKPRILNEIAAHRRIALFSHDPAVKAARFATNARDELTATPVQ